jgi:hypothetical protein
MRPALAASITPPAQTGESSHALEGRDPPSRRRLTDELALSLATSSDAPYWQRGETRPSPGWLQRVQDSARRAAICRPTAPAAPPETLGDPRAAARSPPAAISRHPRSSGRRRTRHASACPRPLANPAESPYLHPWRARTPLPSVDPASANQSYTKTTAYVAPAGPFSRRDEFPG